MSRNNINYKNIRAALQLRSTDVHEIMGGKASKSLIDGWGRSEDATKSGSGNSGAKTLSRFRPMSDEHFDYFCKGLRSWMSKENE